MTSSHRPNRVKRPRQTPVWVPPDSLTNIFPDVSGNEINGLGETSERAPTPIMWANPSTIAHGSVQTKMTTEFAEHPQLQTVLRMDDRHEPAPIAPRVWEASPEEATSALRAFALSEADNTCDDIAVARLRDEWFYSQKSTTHSYIILLVQRMDHAELATAPESTSAMEVHRQYNRGTFAAREVADWIRDRGHEAVGHGGPGCGPVLLLPAAIEAGLGELGKHGSLIHPEFGSSFRLSAVLTDLPLVSGQRAVFGADDFCHGCRVCSDACPPDAIAHTEQVVRGKEKWYVDFDKCMPYFAASYGCGICIARCPWSIPGEAPRLGEIMTAKRQRRLTQH